MTAAPANVVVGDGLVEDRPAERDRHDWVDVGVCRDPRDRRVLQQPRVGGEREPGPEHHEIGERDERARAEFGGLEIAQLAHQRACQRADSASEEHLPAPRHERVAGQRHRASRRPSRRPTSPPRRRRSSSAEQRRAAGLLARQQEQRDAGEADEHGGHAAPGDAVAEPSPVEDHPRGTDAISSAAMLEGTVDLGPLAHAACRRELGAVVAPPPGGQRGAARAARGGGRQQSAADRVASQVF